MLTGAGDHRLDRRPLQELKVELDKLLVAKVSDPSFDISQSGLIEVITQLISTDGLIGPQEAAMWS
jgi:hypothetical protein